MISFEHQGWTVQIFASTAPACPLIVLPTFAEAVAPVREALADAPDFTLVSPRFGFAAEKAQKKQRALRWSRRRCACAPERGVAAADRSCASSAANLARHRRLFAGGTFCRVRALSLRSFSARCQHERLAVVSGFSGFRAESCHARQAGADLSLRRRQRAQDPPPPHAQRADSCRRFCRSLSGARHLHHFSARARKSFQRRRRSHSARHPLAARSVKA